VFFQAIEHLDQDGYSGNLSDMLLALTGSEITHHGKQNHHLKDKSLFVKNEPISCLMIPPDHRAQMAPIVRNLSDLINTGHEKTQGQNQGQGHGNDR
jgi:hypothetical protein